MSVQLPKDAIDISATVTAEMLLGKIRPGNLGEPHYLHSFRRALMPIKKIIGGENMGTLADMTKPIVHATVAMLADKVVGFEHPKTKEQVRSLPVPFRAAAELSVHNLAPDGDKRWEDELWSLRKLVREIIETSPSGLTAEELRLGYDDLIHAIVDKLFERWETLIN